MLLGVKKWRCVKVDIFLVVDGWNDKEFYHYANEGNFREILFIEITHQ